MQKCHRWLQAEIERWRLEGVISTDQARLLSARYDRAQPDRARSRLIFSALGAVIFGLGVILFFAYNWHLLDRLTKLAIVVTALLAAHGVGWWLSADGRTHNKLAESLHLLGTMLFGAGIWLVAQVYHIDEHYPNGFLVWSLGALSLAWALPSAFQGLLALFLVFMWSWSEIVDFHHLNHWGAWLVAVGIIPLAWVQRSRVLLFFSLAVFMALYAFTVGRVNDDLVLTALFVIAGAYLAWAHIAPMTTFLSSAPIFQSVGYAVYLVLLFLLSFGDVGNRFRANTPLGWLDWVYWALPLIAAAGSWGLLLARRRDMPESVVERTESWLILGTTLAVVLSSLGLQFFNWLLFNLVFLAHGAIFVLRGTHELRWQRVALGAVMFAALIFARFLDLFNSLLLRSLVFLILGAGLFAIGHLYSRQKDKLREELGHA